MTREVLAEENFCPRCSKRLGSNDWDIHTCTPPQRTWVGLTRTELIRCGVLPFGLSYELYEAIEAKLKQKNT